MKVFTCTPLPFGGDAAFMARDSGLLSAGLCALGVESRPIIAGPPMEGDDPRVLRADVRDMETASWWKTMSLDGLVFYSWAWPRFNGIARAIREAGIPLLVNMDTSGLLSPLANSREWLRAVAGVYMLKQPGLAGKARETIKAVIEWGGSPQARGRLAHYEAASVVAAVTPHAALWIPNEARQLGRLDLSQKFVYLPHPQLPVFTYDGHPKEKRLISVGRWRREDWAQKNPRLLLDACRLFLSSRPDWHVVIIGSGAPQLLKMLGMDPRGFGGRIEFIDQVKPDVLPDHYRRASIGLWSSRWEGQQGAAAQALCCGCSVVSVSSAPNNCFRHYVSRESGRLATRNNPRALADELILEADAWERGERDPERISRIWTREFHAPEVARRALAALGLS
jgi:glycosyltransferase involved in cell wall biosynthesis